MRCPACGAPSGPAARFCDQCGSPLLAPATAPTGARAARPRRGRTTPEPSLAPSPDIEAGDRRVVTALFADLVDYVRMLAEHDAEVVKLRVDAALAAMDAAVVQYGGRREKFIGDAIFAVFGYPRSHGDDALRASLAALAIRAALADPENVGDEPLTVRIGIATGEVVAAPRAVPGNREVSLTGPAVVIAARIQGLAGPGEILLDDATLHASRGRLDVDDRGTRLLRGHTAPVKVHALRSDLSLSAAEPPAGRLIGRRTERERLRRLLDECRRTGTGRIGIVIGEPGMGKSRLLADLEAEARSNGFRWTWAENVSYATGEPYRFVRHLAQVIADEQGTDSGSMARRLLFTDDLDPKTAQRVAGGIAAIAREAAASGWEAEESFVPADPAEMTGAILDATRRYTLRLTEVLGPRVIVIDDVHWTDRSSVPMIDQLVEMARHLPLVILFGSRPGHLAERYASITPGRPGAPFADARIDLAGLAPSETAELASVVAGAELEATGARALHHRTGGNPLFVGETVRALLDDGSLAIEEGRVLLVRETAGGLPVTLRALLGARIDALSAAARDAIGVASVIGITFDAALVGDLVGRPLAPRVLDRLAQSALVVPVEGRTSWRFAHALIRDAAYAGLLTSRRRTLHARLAERLEAAPGAGIGEAALHRVAAGDHARALPLLEEAARQARAIGAISEAAGFYATAAEVAAGDPARAAEYRQAADAVAIDEAAGDRVGTGLASGS